MCSSFSIFLSRNLIAQIVLFFLVFIVPISLMFRSAIKKYPPYIAKKNKSFDELIVYVPLMGRFGCHGYTDHTFVKRKNGKYKLKLSVFSLIVTLVMLLFFICAYVFVISAFWSSGGIVFDVMAIVLYIYLFIFFGIFYVWANFDKIVAKLYFKKLLKGLKDSKSNKRKGKR